MANLKHLEVLEQGVDKWHQWREWRKKKTTLKPDLSGANLSRAELSQFDLSNTDLSGANLSEAKLIQVNFEGAILTGAKFIKADARTANFHKAELVDANFSDAVLCKAVFAEAYLRGAIFRGANLERASFNRAMIDEADFSDSNLIRSLLNDISLNEYLGTDITTFKGANMSKAEIRFSFLPHIDLRDANLSGADLSASYLGEADLCRAKLHAARCLRTNLTQAVCELADFSEVDLSEGNLINVKLNGSNLTGARLWETQRAGWSIRHVICELIYWDEEAKVKATYNPGDFERLFAETTRVKLFFKDGISPLEIATLPALIKHLEAAHSGCGLRLVSIHDDAGGAVVELAIEDDDQHAPEQMPQLQAALEAEAQQRIEYQRQALVEREARLQLEGEVRQLDSVVDKLIRYHTINIHQGGSMAGDTYNIPGQAGAVGPNAHAHDMTFNQVVNHVEQNIDLTELARQLSELRQAMAQKQDSPQAAIAISEVAKAELAATEKNTPKVVEHLKAAGKWTMDFAKDIGKDLVVEVIKKASGMP